MTSPLTPEAVAQMVADREAGTPGPFKNAGGENATITDDSWMPVAYYVSATNRPRFARLPDLEAAYLTLAAENATLREENEELDFLRHEGGPDSVAAMETELATLRASEAAAMEALAEIERIYYTEGKDLSWRAAHMRAIATAILTNAAKG